MENLDKIASGITISLGGAAIFLLYYSYKTKKRAEDMYQKVSNLLKTYQENTN